MHLKTTAGKPNYYDIVDFVPFANCEQVETTVSGGGNEPELVIKSGQSKPKLHDVSFPQWSAANMAILDRLIDEGLLSQQGMRQYMNYTYRFSQLAIHFEWQSLLAYDREYRKNQSVHGYAWGFHDNHLFNVHLKRKYVPTVPTINQQRPYEGKGSSSKQQGARKTSNNKSVQLCIKFNRGTCTYNPCKFAHLCSMDGCAKPHPMSQHDSHSSQQGN